MTDFFQPKIILISDCEDIINFCKDVFDSDFNLVIMSNLSDITHITPSLVPVLIVDCVFSPNMLAMCVERIPDFKGAIIFLVENFSFNEVAAKQTFPNCVFMPFLCDADFFRGLVEDKIKEWKPDVVLPILDELKNFEEDVPGFEKIISRSESVYKVKKMLASIAEKDISLLLLGESGTGKSFAAEIVHENSLRRDKKFKSINMATIPEMLAESTLFGSVKGAYTDAVNRAGLFMEANGGTIFMDEISELSLPLQAKLLTVLDNGKFYSVGSDKEKQVDVRIIFATNSNLQELVREKKFRKDLYFRIMRMKVVMPPLRKRREDIRLLAENHAAKFEKKISNEAIRKLETYSWPGNIRELYNCIEKASLFCQGEIIEADDINFYESDFFD